MLWSGIYALVTTMSTFNLDEKQYAQMNTTTFHNNFLKTNLLNLFYLTELIDIVILTNVCLPRNTPIQGYMCD